MAAQRSTPLGGARTDLLPLGSVAGYRLAPGEPDIRGWDYLTTTGARVGTVTELLIDPAADEVRAAVVAVEGGAADRPRVVAPLQGARFDEARRAVVSTLTPRAIAALPEYAEETRRGGTRGAESAPHAAPHPGVTVEQTADGGQVIKVPIVEEELVVERRPVVKEVVVIRKHPVREAQVVEAELRKERLEVDHRDAERNR